MVLPRPAHPSHTRCNFASFLLLACLLLLAADSEGKLSETEFSRLMAKFRHEGRELPDTQFHLLYEQVNTMFWNSPDSLGREVSSLENTTYRVVLYEIAPFVRIADPEAVEGDPGNANQTRTSRNGGITGITIEFLNLVEYHTGANFHYLYPCRRADYELTGLCEGEHARLANESIAMLASGSSDETSDYIGGGRELCGSSGMCFSAGAHKISESLLIRHYLSQPIMMTGYRLVTLAVPDSPTTFDWASPFDYSVWIVIAVEILVCGVAIFIVEYKADNDALATNPILRMCDTIYFSISIVLGVSDKQPITHGGRTIVLSQLFLALILQAVFTGNLNNILLRQPFKTNVDSFQDYTNPSSSKFNARNTICYPASDLVAKNYLDLEAGLYQDVAVNIETAPDMLTCLKRVYTGEVTSTFYDAPVLQAAIGTHFLQTGKCGLKGGYCSEWNTKASDCHCNIPEPGCNVSVQACEDVVNPTCNLTFTPTDESLMMVGEIFNPVGYVLVFPRAASFTDHLAFNQVLLYIKEQGELDSIIQRNLAPPTCASPMGVVPQVGLINMVGLIICVMLLVMIGFGVGYMEVIMRIVRRCGCTKIPGMIAGCCSKKEEPVVEEVVKTEKPFKNLAPPVLPLNFSQIPVQACLEEIKDRLQVVERTLDQANLQAGAAINTFQRSMPQS